MPKVEANGEELFNLAISIIGLVMREAVVSKTELARHFGVSERSIERAVMAISLAEDGRRFASFFDLDWDAWEEGEVSLRPLGELRSPPPLSRAQSAALATAIEHFATLPEYAGNQALSELRAALQSVPVARVQATGQVEHLVSQLRAVVGVSRVRLEYVNQVGEISEREVDPVRIDLVDNRHYLRAWCHLSQAARNFRLDRITAITLTQQAISPEARALELADNLFESDPGNHRVEILASATGREIFWNFPVVEPPVKNSEGYRGVIKIANLSALGRHIARYGGAVRVLGPAEARAAVADFARRALGETEVE
jgi:proteasome accessory factor C